MCECHTHKYDPIEHKDYYSLYAFLTKITNRASCLITDEAAPTVLLPTPTAEKSLDSLKALMQSHMAKTQVTEQYKKDLENWLLSMKDKDKSFLKEPVGRVMYLDFEKQDTTLIADLITPPSKAEVERRVKELEKVKQIRM